MKVYMKYLKLEMEVNNMYDFEGNIYLEGLVWQSDWNGNEVGFDDVAIVGLYSQERADEKTYNFYIDMETMRILDFWVDEE